MQNQRNLTQELVTRDNQYSFFKYIGMLPNPDKILNRTGKSIEAYRDLKNDPHVWSCIQSRKSGLLSLEYMLLANGATEKIVKEIESIIAEFDFQQIQRDILEAPLFGFQPLEIIWDLTPGKYRFYYPKSIIAKPQEWFFFDGEGNLRYRKIGDIKGELPPPMKIINVQYEASYMNPYGNILLAKCYWPVTFKNGGLRFWVNFMEKYGMPILVGQYTRGATQDELEKLVETLSDMTQDSVIVSPADIDIKLQEAARTSSVSLYKELISHCNAEISKAILSQTLTTELQTGSLAAAQTHFRVRREVIQSDVRLVENTMNTLIKYIIDLNFAGSKYPKFHVLFNDADNIQKVDRDLKLTQTGNLRFTKKYWMDSYGFKEDEVEILNAKF